MAWSSQWQRLAFMCWILGVDPCVIWLRAAAHVCRRIAIPNYAPFFHLRIS
jgi:hypothetical protein